MGLKRAPDLESIRLGRTTTTTTVERPQRDRGNTSSDGTGKQRRRRIRRWRRRPTETTDGANDSGCPWKSALNYLQAIDGQGGSSASLRMIRKSSNKDLIKILECAKNIIKGGVHLNETDRARVRKHRDELHDLIDKKINLNRKRKILNQHGGYLISTLAGVLKPLFSKTVRCIGKKIAAGATVKSSSSLTDCFGVGSPSASSDDGDDDDGSQ
jgi:hypothetical protein